MGIFLSFIATATLSQIVIANDLGVNTTVVPFAGNCAHLVTRQHDPLAEALGVSNRLSDGVGVRGALASSRLKPGDPIAEPILLDIGVIPWKMPVFAVSSLEEAIRRERIYERAMSLHKKESEQTRNVHDRGLYAIIPNGENLIREGMSPEEIQSVAAQMMQAPIYEMLHSDDDPSNWANYSTKPNPDEVFTPRRIDPRRIVDRLDPQQAKIVEKFPGEGIHLDFATLNFPTPYGIVEPQRLIDNNGLPKRMSKKMRPDFYPPTEQGKFPTSRLVVTVNRDLRKVMEGCNRPRRSQSQTAQRICEDEMLAYLVMQKVNDAFSFETYSEEQDPATLGISQKLVSGMYGHLGNGIIEVDSVFFSKPDTGRYQMELFVYSLPEKVRKNLIILAGPISNWTAMTGGLLISGEEAIRRIDGRARPGKIIFDSSVEVAPPVSDDIKKRPFGVNGDVPDKRQNKFGIIFEGAAEQPR